MCELYYFSGYKNRYLNSELKILFSHSDTNPNGWGIYFKNEDTSFFQKGPEPAHYSKELKDILEKPIYAYKAMGHIRHASIGANAYHNSHPFRKVDVLGREWVFMHNGSIFEGPVLDRYKDEQEGQTDSERILLYMVDSINKAFQNNPKLTEKEQFLILENIVEELAPENKLNLIVSNDDWTAVHVNMEKTLYEKKVEEGQLISTVPLSDEGWIELPINTLLIYKNGERIYTGKKHPHVYIEDEERLQALLDLLPDDPIYK